MSDRDRILEALADGEQSCVELSVSAGLPLDRTVTAVLTLNGEGLLRHQVDQGTKIWGLA